MSLCVNCFQWFEERTKGYKRTDVSSAKFPAVFQLNSLTIVIFIMKSRRSRHAQVINYYRLKMATCRFNGDAFVWQNKRSTWISTYPDVYINVLANYIYVLKVIQNVYIEIASACFEVSKILFSGSVPVIHHTGTGTRPSQVRALIGRQVVSLGKTLYPNCSNSWSRRCFAYVTLKRRVSPEVGFQN